MGIRELDLDSSYIGYGDDLLNDFLLPVINEAVYYDRITSFYTVDSLLAISQGVDQIYKKQGRMRLILGIHSVPKELVDASLRREYLKEKIATIRNEVQTEIASISEELDKKRLETVAWMIEDGILEVKTAAVCGNGIFHPKMLIFSDWTDTVVAIGSPNETSSGLGNNFEQLAVLFSWNGLEGVEKQKQVFERFWNNEVPNATVCDISSETASMIQEVLGNKEQFSTSFKKCDPEADGIVANSARMLANYFVSGDIPALYMHQERAVIDALSRWPVRVLFADEVGLGKTFEVAATMNYLIKYGGVKRVVILTPKSVLKQWQDELYEHFRINAWIYDSYSKTFYDHNSRGIYVGSENPLGKLAPKIVLFSAQLARGSGRSGDLFSRKGVVFPDLLIVDEAHSARVTKTLSNSQNKTRMYSMLENVVGKIPHLILATATPMQKDADEYHAILKLLGLPKIWQKSRLYQTSLRIIGSKAVPDQTDASSSATLLVRTIENMKPCLERFDDRERKMIDDLVTLKKADDSFEIGNYVQSNWEVFRKVFIQLHPAHLLTVRNTRRSLSEVGYRFPIRNLHEESIESSIDVQLFYSRVERYLSKECFQVEQALYPDRKISLGFVAVSYQQRVASSLYSCKKSLERRYERILGLKKRFEGQTTSGVQIGQDIGVLSSSDDLDSDELLNIDCDDIFFDDNENIDVKELKRAIGIEATALSSLLRDVDKLLKSCGDKKVTRSIQLAVEHLEKGDKVLLFSRYTDTIEALLQEFKKVGADAKFVYGIYTGERASIVDSNIEKDCDKNEIKQSLFSGYMKLVFCSDAASEGLNLQAARVLINVDVPWTPARLEQRIGRIARLGQVADEVEVYNVWYPYSVEARMYHRIQQRLEETNLAIGEFPEVIATSIRNSLINDVSEDTDGIDELLELRNSVQTHALEELWTRSDGETISRTIRTELLDLCGKVFPFRGESLNGRIKKFEMPDGSIIDLSSEEGMQESISLTSVPWKFVDYSCSAISVLKDEYDRPALFALKENGWPIPIKHEAIFQSVLSGNVNNEYRLMGRPIMLPDSLKLDMSFAVDSSIEKAPNYWDCHVEGVE